MSRKRTVNLKNIIFRNGSWDKFILDTSSYCKDANNLTYLGQVCNEDQLWVTSFEGSQPVTTKLFDDKDWSFK